MSDFFDPLPPDAPPEPIGSYVTSSARMSSPGPGAYSTRRDFNAEIPKIKIKGRHEEKIYVNNAPYSNIPTTIGTGRKWTMKGRTKLSEPESTPGPYDYSKPLGSDSPKICIHTKSEVQKVDVGPGPGEYKVTTDFGDPRKGPRFHGPSERSMPVKSDTPGPGTYMVRAPQTARGGRIGQRTYKEHYDDTPGPGQYSTPRLSPNRNKGYIGQVITRSVDITGPGPATYNTDTKMLANVPRIYMHGRTKEHVDVTTAPYNDTRPRNSSPKYSMRSRYYTTTETTPGVNYVPPEFGKDLPAVKISGSRRERSVETTGPGPGAYQISKSFGSDAIKSTFHGPRTRGISTANTETTPSPADYSYNLNGIRASSPKVTIGRRYGTEKYQQTGEYVQLQSTLRGPKYSMRPRATLDICYG